MIYKNFKDLKLSALGMGAMRLPLKGDDFSDIDQEETEKMVEYAMKQGINYYDTAWGYHDGRSEVVMGNILKKYPREKYYLADKFPGYDLANMDKVEEIFEEQLKRCGVDYFDFYLFHNICELNIEQYLDEKYGIYDYLIKQKQNGRIRHLGFSTHGAYEVTKRFLEAYGKDMEFCQVQLNYIDWDFQNAKDQVELLKEYNIPVWVMEPLRGGKLASIPDEYSKKLQSLRPEETIPAWAFRFLQSIPQVVMTLSGMSNFQQMKDNIETFKEERPLNNAEMDAIFEIAGSMVEKIALPCTECRYCVTHCSQELDIPMLLSLYNEHSFTGGGFLA
ncbi:MAG: aldo/keto reductase, partial [Bacillota bacterium]|nr:aldo/keto reductase [Bacillota bacterium]